MPIPPLGLLIRAHVFNHLHARVELAQRYSNTSRLDSALTAISNRERRLAAAFETGRLSASMLLDQARELAVMGLRVNASAQPFGADTAVGISTAMVHDALHLKLLSIRNQVCSVAPGAPRAALSQLILDFATAHATPSTEDGGSPAALPAAAVDHQRCVIPEQLTIHRAPRDPLALPEWWEPARIFRSNDAIPSYESFSASVDTAVEKALRTFHPGCAQPEEARCRLTFEQLVLLRRQKPWNPQDAWVPKRTMLSMYRELKENDAVQRLLAARRGECADAGGPRWQEWGDLAAKIDSAIGSMESMTTYAFLDHQASCSEADDSDTWSDGESDAPSEPVIRQASRHGGVGALVI